MRKNKAFFFENFQMALSLREAKEKIYSLKATEYSAGDTEQCHSTSCSKGSFIIFKDVEDLIDPIFVMRK